MGHFDPGQVALGSSMNAPIVDNALSTSFKCSAICDSQFPSYFASNMGPAGYTRGARGLVVCSSVHSHRCFR